MSETFGNRLKALRKSKGLNQTQLAEKIGVSLLTLFRWEKDERQPRMNEIKARAKALGVSEADLLNDTPEKSRDWVISFKTVAHFNTEEVVDMTGVISPVCSIQAAPNGCGLVIKGDWKTLATKKGLEELFRQVIRDFYKPIQTAGIAYGEIPDEEKNKKKRR